MQRLVFIALLCLISANSNASEWDAVLERWKENEASQQKQSTENKIEQPDVDSMPVHPNTNSAIDAVTTVSYSDCIIDNMKSVGSQGAAYHIQRACRKKALPYVPEKCRLSNSFSACINSCLDASYMSKNFGDCKP